MSTEALPVVAWPDSIIPTSYRIGRESHRFYPCPDGIERPGVTTVLGVMGLSKNVLVDWSAREAKAATLAAVVTTSDKYPGLRGQMLANEVEKQSAVEKAHRRKMEKAGDIGSQAHAMVQWTIQRELGLSPGPEPPMSDGSMLAFMAFEDWRKDCGLTPVRVEQTVWDETLDYAGTIDTIWSKPDGSLVIGDLKSSKGIYDEQHVQVAAYAHAARNWAPISESFILRVPKTLDDPLFQTPKPFEVRPLGQMYNRTLSEAELVEVFMGASAVFNLMCRERGKDA